MTEEFNGLQVFIFSILVRNPLALLPSIVQIQHGSHSVYPQAVYMIFLNPEQCIGDKEVFHFIFAIVKDLGTPVRMFSLSGVCVFVSRGSIEVCQSMGVSGEVGGNPIQDDADLISVHIIDKITEILGSAIAGGRRIITCYLIAPGAVKGMLCDSHQFYMSIAHFLDIVRKSMGQLPIIIKSLILFVFPGMFFPGTWMNLVNRHGVFLHIKLLAFLHPCGVRPLIISDVHDSGGGTRAQF